MTWTSDSELLPCAGCGSTGVQIESRRWYFFAICKECGTSGAAYPTLEQAARSWNKRNRRKGDCDGNG